MIFKTVLRSCTIHQRKLTQTWVRRRKFHNNCMNLPATSIGHIKGFLRQRNVNIQEGHACISLNCPICNVAKTNEFKVFVNKATGK